ncbi:type II secretion system F family protein [Xylophilus sp.]|uniref:type II secretion system F family protein n=1 Tax=Xylophilus sp. TaxID=2653893 RepID=UPI0013B94927|nr:type II secretion system F family protein [Xylophilus sp.]KAF1041947.1 MAG: hypothetical protein GAK38_04469 [Xylophilus sp.]
MDFRHTAFDPRTLAILALALLALAALLVAGALAWRQLERSRSRVRLDRTIHARSASDPVVVAALEDPAEGPAQPAGGEPLPLHWLDSGLGQALVAAEDRRLLDQAGLRGVRARWVYLVARLTLAGLLPLSALLLGEALHGTQRLVVGFVALAAGFMAPKWAVSSRAAGRCRAAGRELPLLVDLLRLLQGVGRSLDQSLQVIGNDFQHVLPVLGGEVAAANRLYGQGRSREHSLQRLATLHESNRLADLVALLVQVDRHGGAVQEPLKAYGERLRENRRSAMKEHIGKVTVKMTGVMVLTLLPALLLITAGPGFLAVIKALGALAR